MSSAPPAWLITGASSGFGKLLALHVLKQGHRAIATVRNRSKASSAVNEIESAGGKVIEMDVTAPEALLRQTTLEADRIYDGGIDILVNNAGFGLISAVEDITDAEARSQFDTNFFGPLTIIRTLLPSFREKGSRAAIVNISSTAGITVIPSGGLYSASKFALEGLSEGLKLELAPFGTRVLIINPGMFRTNFQSAVKPSDKKLSEAYKDGPVDKMMKWSNNSVGNQSGDPEKGVEAIFNAVVKADPDVMRVMLGKGACRRFQAKIDSLQHDLDAGRDIAQACDYPQ